MIGPRLLYSCNMLSLTIKTKLVDVEQVKQENCSHHVTSMSAKLP